MQTIAPPRAKRVGVLGPLLLVAALALAGCAALPGEVDRPVSHARVDARDTALAKIAAASTPVGDPMLSGFRLLPDGDKALEARIALIRRAEKRDRRPVLPDRRTTAPGASSSHELAAAAARGVRVRILADDLSATGADALLAALASQPNVEVRLFNPLARARRQLRPAADAVVARAAAHQPPNAQQALRRRQQLRHHRRSQHR